MLMVLLFVLGAFGWTLAEYLIHRFLFHAKRPRQAIAREHLEHHRVRLYFAPAALKLQIAVAALVLQLLVLAPLLGLVAAFTFVSGFVLTYLFYEALHRDLHLRAPRTAFGRFLRKHHMHHHHADPSTNHGVTLALWDRVFGTLRTADRVRVPRAKAPSWMVDAPADAPWVGDYELFGR